MKLEEIIKQVSGNSSIANFDMSGYIDMWNDWYRGKSASFHNYCIYNGKKTIQKTRLSLGMAKRVCEDWANLLINEKTDVVLSNDADQKSMNNILQECNFWTKANEGIEKTFALGMGAFVVNVDNMTVNQDGEIVSEDGKVNVWFINATKIIPVTVEDGKITECAFINVGTKKTYIAIHLKDEAGVYKIHNIEAEGTDMDRLSYTETDYYVFDTKATLPWFSIVKPNIANNININSPFGISVFANSIDTLKEIDLIFDSNANEFNLGRKRIFVSASQVTIDPVTGEAIEVFDANDVAYYILPENDDGSQMIQDSTQTLRVSEHQTGIQHQLNLLSYQSGFGTQHYRFDAGSVATATQIISENSEMFRTIKKHEIIIEKALVEIFRAIMYASNNFTSIKFSSDTVEIKFDDSIIEDKVSEKASDRIDVSMGVMSKAEYRAKWYGEDINTATKAIEAMSSVTITED